MGPGLGQGLGVAEVVGPREVLTRPVEPAGGQELLGADQPERGTQLGPDQVLAAFAPVERQVGGLDAQPAHQQGEQLRVLVVRMGADHQHPSGVTEEPQLVLQRDHAAGGWRLELGRERQAGDGERQESGTDGE
jgi:hypothetical protein